MKKKILRVKKVSTIFLSEKPEDTANFAKKISGSLGPGDVILLRGEYGSGKTVFVKGLASGLGIRRCVTSPSYVYLRKYSCGEKKLYHFDIYRIPASSNLDLIGLEPELIKDGIAAVEWGGRLAGRFSKSIDVSIRHLGGNRRRIEVKRKG